MTGEPPTAAEVLAELTGRPVEDFQPPDGVEYPHPDKLDSVEVAADD